jgi:flagellar FliJ protein
MARFVFKLQPLLNVKMQMEESLKNDLGKAVQKLEEEKNMLKHIESEREDYISEIGAKSSMGITVEKLKEYSSYISLLTPDPNNSRSPRWR